MYHDLSMGWESGKSMDGQVGPRCADTRGLAELAVLAKLAELAEAR